MKEIFIDFKLTNYVDLENVVLGFIKQEEVRNVSVNGKIDTGSTVLVIPQEISNKLGLRKVRERQVEYADGRREKRPLMSGVEVEINGRHALENPVVGSNNKILVSNHVIETMDFLIDTVTGKLLPRHPESDLPVEIIE